MTQSLLPTIEDSLLLVVDVQGKLARLMADSEAMIERQRILIQACRLLGLPVVWAEQLPDKLGPTVPELAEVLTGLTPLTKSSFGCLGDEALKRKVIECRRRHIILCGIETHVCVWQTAAALKDEDFEVHLVCDAVSSRSRENHRIAIHRMRAIGVHPSSVEMVLFELMGDAHRRSFREVTRLLK